MAKKIPLNLEKVNHFIPAKKKSKLSVFKSQLNHFEFEYYLRHRILLVDQFDRYYEEQQLNLI